MSYPPPKYDEDTTSTISLKLTENCEKSSTLMLSKDPCQDQSIPSSCSTISCSLLLSTLPKSFQDSNAPIKEVSPIQDANDLIENSNAHSKDADILDCHIDVDELIDYPFASSTSILGPHPPILNSSILGPYVPPSPIFPQDQCQCISLNPFHSPIHLNHSYHPSSFTSPNSFGSILNVQHKKKKKYKNISKKQDHYVFSNRHRGIISKKKTTR